MSTPCLREECCVLRKQINDHWGPENSRLQTELAAANDKLAEIEKAAELPEDALVCEFSLDSPPEYENAKWVDEKAYNAIRTHALHLAAANARLREDARHAATSMVMAFQGVGYAFEHDIIKAAEADILSAKETRGSTNDALRRIYAIDAARKGKA